MTPKEIGSEYHSMPYGNGAGIDFPKVTDYVLTFSGRTAIETVLKNEPHIKKALLPSYCCDSMIEPFRRAGIEVLFFSVFYDEKLQIDLIIPDDIDCILWCNYFGFSHQMPDFGNFIRRGGIIIEDITHSFYSNIQYHEQSNYLVASLRKWEPIYCGGYCGSVSKVLKYKPKEEPPQSFLTEKRIIMERKSCYLEGKGNIDKAQFLSDFSKSNAWLAVNYSGFRMDSASETYLQQVNQTKEKEQRIANAGRLYEQIRTNEFVNFMFDESDMDCPLFVPMIIKKSFRDILRKELTNRNIFCPIHWPHPIESCGSNLYDMELSLICDQRYTEKDMDYIATVINSFAL